MRLIFQCRPGQNERPAFSSMSRSLASLGMTLVAACASVGNPPGGPVDTEPPEVISASIDTNATGVKASKLELRFNELVAERPSGAAGTSTGAGGLDAIVLVSPRTGPPKVEWHRETISIEPRGGFRPNTTYRITLLPGVTDIRGNVNTVPHYYTFSTGSTIPPFAILGRVFDWQLQVPAPGAIVEAVANAGTADSTIYIAVADSLGQFDIGPLSTGKYLVRTFIDADRNRDRGVLEKWDTLTVTVTDHRPAIELLAAQRDTAIIGVDRAQALDSVWIRVQLDKQYVPRTQLQPTQVVVQREDSSVFQVMLVLNEDEAAFLRARDTTARPTSVIPPAALGGRGTSVVRPPEARPSAPPLRTVLMLRVNPATPLKTGEPYILTVRALRNLLGNTGTSRAVFDGPPGPPKPPG
jgi:hypothetical protein